MSSTPVARFLILSAAFVIVVAGMRAAETLLIPFLLSLFIAVICSPALLWLKSRGVPSFLSLLLIVAVIAGAGTFIGAIVGASISDFRQDLPTYQERLIFLRGQLEAWLATKGYSVPASLAQDILDPGVVLSFIGNTLASFGNVMTNAFLILLTVIFILAEEVGFSDKLVGSHPKGEAMVAALQRFTSSVNRYMAIKSVLSLLTGFLITLWLWWIGVDFPVLWGMLAFLLNFVPNLGSILAAVPTVLLALIQLGVGDAVLTGVGYLLVNTLVGNGLEPRLMGRGLNLSTLVVFLSLVFWGWVLGPVGMLLSVPLTMTVKIALESGRDTRWLGQLLGSGKAPS